MIPRCSGVSMRSNQWCLAETFNEVADLLLCQNAIECSYKVAHGSFAVTSYYIIDRLDMTNVVLPGNSPNLGLI